MKILIDTSLPKMLLLLLNEKEVIFKFTSTDKKKADILPQVFYDMLLKANVDIHKIKEFYVTTGSGSFMGSRTALTFVRTIAQITGAKMFLADPMAFVGFKSSKPIYLDAKSGHSYKYDPSSKKTTIVDFVEDSKIDYQNIINNPFDYLEAFKEVDADRAQAFYLKDPKIGGN